MALFPTYSERVEYLDIEDGHLEPVTSALSRLSRYIESMLDDLQRS